jgi:hypothetical protein
MQVVAVPGIEDGTGLEFLVAAGMELICLMATAALVEHA